MDWNVSRRGLFSLIPTFTALRLKSTFRQSGPAQNFPGTLAGVDGIITPAEKFFVRDHFEEPALSIFDWRLKIEGQVANPIEVTFSDLLLAPAVRRHLTLECAGNGSPGFAVSTGLWTGVPLSMLLAASSPRPSAAAVLLEGSDEGVLLENARRGPYTRIVPMANCMAPEALLAYELNRQLLPPRNGFPARALLPGSYGMDSVKWLRRIVVLEPGERPWSFFETGMDLLYLREFKGVDTSSRLGRLQLKSEIAVPSYGARLLAGTQRVWGFAWGTESLLRKVLVSTDGGRNWQQARFETAPNRFLWARWSFNWEARPGDYTLLSRAEDESGRLQPLFRDPLRTDGYELNQCARITCSVR